MNFVRTYHRRIVIICLAIGFACLFAVVTFAPVGLLILASLALGMAAIVAFVSELLKPYDQTISRWSKWTSYGFGIFLILLGFCGPLYLLVLFYQWFGVQ